MSHPRARSVAVLAVIALAAACGSPPPQRPDGTTPVAPAAGSTFEQTAQSFGSGGNRKLLGNVPAMDETAVPWGGTVNLQRPSDPANLNPVTRTDNESAQVCRLLYPQLAKVHPDDLVLYPWMAESLPTLSDDKLVYTWHLRKGVKWLDGSGDDVTAHDYRTAWEKMMDPAVDAAHRRAQFENYADLTVVDDYTFTVTMKEPYFAGVWNMGYEFMPIPAKIFAKLPGAEFNEHAIRREPIPFGLFRMKSWNRQVDLVLERDDTNAEVFAPANFESNLKNYHIDQLRWVFVKDLVAAFEMLQAGEVDIMAMSADDWTLKASTPEFEARFHKAEYYLPQWVYLGWNLQNPMFSDVRVRKALTLLTRRQEVVDTVRHGHGIVINGPAFIHSRAYDDSYPPLPFDPDQASALLAEAGWKGTNTDGWLDKDGVKFSFEILQPNTKSPDSEALEMLSFEQDARKAGIEVKQRPLEWAVFLEALNDRKYECAFLSWIPDPVYEDPYEIWHSSQADLPRSRNHVGYKNPEVDKLLEAIRVEFDDDKRYEMLRSVHRIVGQEYPYTWLWCGQSLVAVSKRWTNVQIHTLGVRYYEWYLTEGGRPTKPIPGTTTVGPG